MAIEVVCAACGADYSVPDSLLGKVIRCKACSGPMSVAASTPAPVKPQVAKPVAAKPLVARPAVVDDDDEDDAPVKPRGGRGNGLPAAKKKSALLPVLLGLGGLTAALAVIVGGVALSGVLDDKPKAVAFNPASDSGTAPLPKAVTPAVDPDAVAAPAVPPATPREKPKPKPPTPVEVPPDAVPDDEPKKAILVTPLPPKKNAPSVEPVAGPRATMDQLAIARAKNPPPMAGQL